ncbi:YaaA family protein [Microbacterium sp.]|uniref:YaaA family protein n=1 Tax=Microbacterium sp. TaxID=51671 RepID=UPI003A891A8D
MLMLLPPSETKRPGGSGPALDTTGWALPALNPVRETVMDALVALSADEDDAARVLKLSARQRGDIAHNAALRQTATMPAVDRYTGVLYDALTTGGLDGPARRWLARHVLIHSAPFGPIAATDLIPAYRLAAGTSVPGLPPLRRVWADAVSSALAAAAPRVIVDLRSEAYAALGPVPAEIPGAYVRVVTVAHGGRIRALNHFNKHAKGALVRTLATSRPRVNTLDGFVQWAATAGVVLRPGAPGELDLVV